MAGELKYLHNTFTILFGFLFTHLIPKGRGCPIFPLCFVFKSLALAGHSAGLS